MTVSKFHQFLTHFRLADKGAATQCSELVWQQNTYPVFTNEFWTSRQRQAHSLHEISYRACFKPQLPRFFIQLFTQKGDTVYDPFNGRGTTAVEAALLGRNVVANDVNPLSLILTSPRLQLPCKEEIEHQLQKIDWHKGHKAAIDLSMFYHPKTAQELVALRNFLRTDTKPNVAVEWIRMVATNRLTGHSKGFFSVYTLPPNQAVSPERQKKINAARNQQPEYRNVPDLILRKTKQLLRSLNEEDRQNMRGCHSLLLNKDAANTPELQANSIALTVTSPPFLDVVQYAADNWLRCWFNDIDLGEVAAKITMSKTVEEWSTKMQQVFRELYRITRPGGVVAFEVGEVRNGAIRLEEMVVPLGIRAGFRCDCILINEQVFTKTSNIWGVQNNNRGTNSNRIVVFRKV